MMREPIESRYQSALRPCFPNRRACAHGKPEMPVAFSATAPMLSDVEQPIPSPVSVREDSNCRNIAQVPTIVTCFSLRANAIGNSWPRVAFRPVPARAGRLTAGPSSGNLSCPSWGHRKACGRLIVRGRWRAARRVGRRRHSSHGQMAVID
jgi:hypothetical protein